MHAVAQDRNRQPRIIRIMRNEWRECIEFHLNGQGRVFEFDVGERILTGKSRSLNAAQSRRIIRAEPVLPFVWGQNSCFQYARNGLRITCLHPNRRQGISGREPLIRAIEYLPISQLSSAAQAQAAGRHPAQGKRNHLELRPSKTTRIGDIRRSLAGPSANAGRSGQRPACVLAPTAPTACLMKPRRPTLYSSPIIRIE